MRKQVLIHSTASNHAIYGEDDGAASIDVARGGELVEMVIIGTVFLLLIGLSSGVNAADIEAVLNDAAGANALSVKDSGSVEQARIDSDGNTVIKGGMRLDASGVKCTTAETLIVDGNVGIGTTSPSAKLSVHSQQSTDVGLLIKGFTGQAADLFRIRNSVDNGLLTVDYSGNVGIGTTAPANKLHVEGAGAGSAGIYLNDAAPSATTATLYNSGGNLYWAGSNLSSGSSLWTLSGSDIYRSSGNVGIGTTGPGAKLDVNSSGANVTNTTAGLIIEDSARTDEAGANGLTISTAGTYAKTSFVRNVTMPGATYSGLEIGTASNHAIRFLINGTDDASEKVRISTTGNVGIGTTAPGTPLQVGTTNATNNIAVMSALNKGYFGQYDDITGIYGNRRISDGVFVDTAKASAGIELQSSAANSYIRFLTTDQNNQLPLERMRILNTGNVGIGTIGPSLNLVVGTDVGNMGLGTDKTIAAVNNGGNSALAVGQDASHNISLRWIYNATAANAYVNLSTYANTNDIRIDGKNTILQPTNGNVGIGTTAPLGKLIVKGAGTTTGIGLQTQNSSGTALVTMLDSGNVGIGTTAPTSALHVVGLPVHANNAAAVAGGLTAGAFYRTNADPDPVCVVH